MNRLEALNKDEAGIYTLLDTLKTVPKFKSYYNLVSILGSGYVEIDKWNMDIGSVYDVFGFNDAEAQDCGLARALFLARMILGDWKGIPHMALRTKNSNTGFPARCFWTVAAV